MSRTYSRRHRQPSPPSPVPNLAWWKSPLILGSIIAGIGIIGSTLWIEYTTQRVIHIRAEDVNRLIKKERDRQNYNPVVVTITLQDTEPVPNQPQPDDQQLQELVHQITAHQGTIMFMVEDPNLSSQLQTVLSNETYAEICSFTDISNCVNKAFEVARKL